MKKKLISVIMCAVVMISMLVMCCAAGNEPDLTLDFNKRYTDILEYDEVSDPYLNLDENSQAKQQKRDIYVVVLVVLLVIAIIVFVYTLRKVPAENEIKLEKKPGPDAITDEKHENTLADEEKKE